MKKFHWFIFPLLLSCIPNEEVLSSTNTSINGEALLQNTAIRFSEGGITFSIYLDGTFDYESSGERVSYNYDGKVSRIGDVFISYNYDGRVSKIGQTFIGYNYGGKVNKVGCMFINYDYSGRVTGTSGDVKCGY